MKSKEILKRMFLGGGIVSIISAVISINIKSMENAMIPVALIAGLIGIVGMIGWVIKLILTKD